MDKDTKKEQEKHKSKARSVQRRGLLPTTWGDTPSQKAFLLAALSLIIAFLLTPTFSVSNPSYQLGDIADRNIKAKQDILLEDEAATSRRREEVVRQAPIIYDLDENVARHVLEKLDAAFELMREYLRENRRFAADPLTPMLDQVVETAPPPDNFLPPDLPDLTKQALQRKKDFENLFGFQVSNEMFSDFLDLRFNRDFQERVSVMLKSAFDQGIMANKTWLSQSQNRNLVIRKLGVQEEYVITPPYHYPDIEEARKFARMQALEQGRGSEEIRGMAFLVSQLLRPNLTFNYDETERRREQAYASVKPVFIQLMRNEMLVREGQRIGPEELLRLRSHEKEGATRHRPIVFFALFLFSGVCICVVVNVARQHIPSYRMEFPDFLFLGVMLVFLLALGQFTMWIADFIGEATSHVCGKTLIFAIPLTAGAMIASIFFGVTVSLIFSLLLTLFAGMLFGKDFGLFFYFLIGSFVAAHGVSSFRNRMIPVRTGLLVGCTNAILIILSTLLQDQWVFLRVLTNALFGFWGGLFAGILVTGLTPLAEIIFGYTTDIKLMELATMDQPLLQELMVQAPGTYHHSIIVGNMVESAAKSIGANSLLAKVAAYYHDIGKIKKPLYFIENQFDCENRHEKLAPSMSSLILIAHVKDGAELARQHKLGKSIIDIISQHHGTSFISFFYKKAMDAREKIQSSKGAELPPINAEDYRYPGPKPQTKEAGLVMLADVVEAACRSLSEPTPARIQGLVNRLINNIFSDGQLEECELTLKDLHHIAKYFNQILATVHHKRIEYPTVLAGDGKAKSDGPDTNQRESKPDRDKPCANRGIGKPDLKRLGIH